MNYSHPFMMGQIPISQQMAMMAQQQQQHQQQMLQQQHHQAPMAPQQASMPPQQSPMQQQQHQPPPQASHVTHASPAATKVPKKRRRKDPNSPKRAMSAYFMFVQKERQEMEKRGEKISKVTEFTKAVSEKWRRMSPVEREPYDHLSGKDKERYEAEMVAFTGKKKDVNKPKKPQTAYFLWLAGWREHNKDKFDHKELLRQAGLVWNRMTDMEKAPYLRAAEEEKLKYEARMREYTSGLSVNKPAAGGGAKQAKVESQSHPAAAPSQHAAPGVPSQQQGDLPGMQMEQGGMGPMSPQSMGQAGAGGNMNMMNYAAAQQAAMAQQFHQMATAYYQQQQQQRLQLQQPGNGNHDNGDDDDDDDEDDDDDDEDGDGSE